MRLRRLLVVLLTVPSAGAFAGDPSGDDSVRLATTAFGVSAEVEVRDLPRPEAEAAARLALRRIFEVARMVDPGARDGGLGALNAAAGKEAQSLPAPVSELLIRGLQICFWSSGAHGPLGGELYRLWGSGEGMPEPQDLRSAVASADCSRLGLTGSRDQLRAQLGEGSKLHALWMARGFAIDQAVVRLRELGVDNAWVEIGPVYRALGEGPDGRGWTISLPPLPGSEAPLDRLFLRDQALAIASMSPRGSPGGGSENTSNTVPLIDQRSGVPARGVVAVIAVTGRALDAEALAATLFILGRRHGQMRLASFEPRPSVYWLLGDGDGVPLTSTYRWSELARVAPGIE